MPKYKITIEEIEDSNRSENCHRCPDTAKIYEQTVEQINLSGIIGLINKIFDPILVPTEKPNPE